MTTAIDASEHPHTGAHRLFEAFGIAAAAALLTGISLRTGRAIVDAPRLSFIAAGAALAGVVLADLFSGVVHWAFDRYGGEDTPIIGASFVRPFRLHHTDPGDILRHGFLETNGNTSLAVVVPLSLLFALPVSRPAGLFAVVALATASLLAVLTNQLHKWAHDDDPPALVALLQRCHVILPRDHHALHHAHPHETHYCITTGWLNATLAGAWPALERALARCGVAAHRDAGAPSVELEAD